MCEHSLQRELATYEREKARLVSEHEGKYVLIHDDDVAGIWGTYEDALKQGYERYGLSPFLVKQIRGTDEVCFLTRDMLGCS